MAETTWCTYRRWQRSSGAMQPGTLVCSAAMSLARCSQTAVHADHRPYTSFDLGQSMVRCATAVLGVTYVIAFVTLSGVINAQVDADLERSRSCVARCRCPSPRGAICWLPLRICVPQILQTVRTPHQNRFHAGLGHQDPAQGRDPSGPPGHGDAHQVRSTVRYATSTLHVTHTRSCPQH